ncbi:hypothetical protein SLS62_008102 [Diatrype stigma]|uniref:Heterokaryon incompatibility domain-containing protein n=1 Tax=Diatrype stigma TaxID=117547 RepID=A0AAN9UY87_9PEZI
MRCTDDLEKSHQIALMSSIYKTARRVVIWLGKPTEATRNALPALREVNGYLKRTLWFYDGTFLGLRLRATYFGKWADATNPRTLTQRQIAKISGFDWASIVTVFRHRWFSRVWMCQEFTNARDAVILVGYDEMPLVNLVSVYAELEFQGLRADLLSRHMGPDDWEPMMNILGIGLMEANRQKIGVPKRKLAELMFDNRTREATDDRDRIFAFVDIAGDVDASDQELAPDYTVPVEEVYRRFALWYLMRKKDLQFLQYASPNCTSYLAGRYLPSWVPDWRQAKFSTPIFRDFKSPYDASANSKPEVRWGPEPDHLAIKGRIVDRVGQVAVTEAELEENHSATSTYELEDTMTIWLSQCRRIAAMGAKRLTKEQFDAWWRLMGITGSPFSEETVVEYLALVQPAMWRRETPGPAAGGMTATDRAEVNPRHNVLRRMMVHRLSSFYQRRFCSTTGGRLGWVPITAKPGDIICIFHGAPVPFVLRPKMKEHQDPSVPFSTFAFDKAGFELVGEAYVDGMMYGAAFKDKWRVLDQMFHLT